MNRRITFAVVGTPAPKGSKSSFVPINKHTGQPFRRPNGGIVVSTVDGNAPAVKAWHGDVALAAREAMHGLPMFVGNPLGVAVVFRLVRPAGHFGKRGLKPTAPRFPSVKPDLDKLLRATMDPLEGIVFDGDSRIARFEVTKVYCAPGEVAGADITVELLEAPAELADASQPALALVGA